MIFSLVDKIDYSIYIFSLYYMYTYTYAFSSGIDAYFRVRFSLL